MAQYQINKYAYALYLELTFTLISQNTANNTSVVRVLGRVVGTGNGERAYGGAGRTGTITFNGVTESFNAGKDYNFPNATAVNFVLFQKDYTVAHNTNGTKSVSGSITWKHDNAYLNSNAGTNTASVSITNQALTTIPRYTTVTNPSISSITRNSYTFSFSTGHTINEWQYSSNGGAWQAGQTGDRTSGSKTLSGFGANTKPTIRVRVKRKDSGLWTESGTVTVTLEATASPNTPTFSSITRNSFVINVGANKSFNGFQYSLNDGTSWSAKVSGSSVSITGRPANTLYNVRVRVYDGVHTGTLSGASGRGQVRTLAIASPNRPIQGGTKTAINNHINWSTNQSVINVKYRLNGGAWVNAYTNNFSATTSGWFDVRGLSPNTTYRISIIVLDAVHTSSWSGASGEFSFTTHALSTITGSNTTVDTGAKSFAISKAVSSMSQDVILQMWADSQKWINIKSWTGTNGGGFTLTASEIASIQNNRTGSNTLSVRYQCTTRWGAGGTVQGTTYSPQYTWTLVDVNPTLSGATYKDVHSNSTFVSWKGGDQKILRNVSQLQVILGTANAIKGAKLSKYVLMVAGKSFTINATSGATTQTGATINAGVVNAGTNQSATIEVFDSRGNKATRAITVQMIDWAEPQIIHGTGERLNSYEKPTYLNFLARYSRVLVGGTDKNSLTAQYRIKVKGSSDSTYSAFVDIIAPNGSVSGIWQEVGSTQFMQNLDENTIYTMHIQYKDYVVGWRNYYVDIDMGVGLMEFFEDKIEVGVPTTFSKGIGIPDTRSIVSVPQDLPSKAVSLDFKFNTSVGNPPVTASTQYSHIINVAGWSSDEGSGGWPMQISVGASGLAVRQATSATAWGAWKSITNTSSSSREIKKDIENTNHQENFDVFKGLKVYDYNLKDEFDEKKTREKDHIGLITDEVPDFLTDKDQSYIKLYDLLSLTVSTLQTTIKKVETLELKVKDLENEIEKLKGGNQ